MRTATNMVSIVMGVALLAACAKVNVIPPALKDRVDRSVTFAELKDAPSAYVGRYLVLGGVVLSGKRLQDGTRLEILQLPLDDSLEPGVRLSESEGRFVAMQKEFLDPATLPPGTRVTIIGEVTGTITLPLDEMEYTYPTVLIKRLTVWPKAIPAYWIQPHPYFGAYWGSYWGPYWAPYWVP